MSETASLVADLERAKAIFDRCEAKSAQDACSRATGELTGGEAFRALLAQETPDRALGWISRQFSRAIALAKTGATP